MSAMKNEFLYLFKIILNSFLVYHLSYMLFHITGIAATALVASDFGIPVVLYNSHVEFLEPRDSMLWSFDAEIFVAVVSPALMFIAAGLMLTIMSLKQNQASWSTSFLAWSMIHAFNFSVGAFISDMLLQTGLFFAAERLQISLSVQISTAIVAMFFLIRVGRICGNRLVAIQYCDQKQSAYKSPIVVLIIPWAIGIIVNLIVLGKNFSSLLWITDVMLLVQLLPAIIMSRKTQATSNSTLSNSRMLILITVWLVMVLLNLVLLQYGIRFAA